MPRRLPSGPLPEVEILLSANPRRQLAETIRCRTAPQRSVERARIVLLASRGERNAAIARHPHLAITTVRLWRRRFVGAHEHGLEDRPRPGRPPSTPISTERVSSPSLAYFRLGADCR